jgi:hypothetical protein
MFHVEQSVADCQCPSLAEMFHVERSTRLPSIDPGTLLIRIPIQTGPI